MELNSDFRQWIADHATDDPTRLRLKFGAARALEILQIEARRKYRGKLGEVFDILPDFVVPNTLSPEQSTSWPLAQFHVSLLEGAGTVADLTAGMGIDVLAFSRTGAAVTAVEREPAIADALAHNFRDVPGVTAICADCRDFVREAEAAGHRFDCIFVDPARRADDGSRLYALAQCSPDVTELMPALLRLAPKVVVKASPMLDITHTLRSLPQATAIYAVGTATECKELVAVCSAGEPSPDPAVTAVTVADSVRRSDFTFTRREESDAEPRYAAPAPGHYIYDPYPAVMKAAPYSLLCSRFGLSLLAPNTRLWTSPRLFPDFPGHIFLVKDVQPYASRVIKRYASSWPRVSVTARNFDLDADGLRRKLGVRDGSDMRLFAVKGPDGSKLLITTTPLPASGL